MSSVAIVIDTIEPIQAFARKASGKPLTALTDVKMKVRNLAGDYLIDRN